MGETGFMEMILSPDAVNQAIAAIFADMTLAGAAHSVHQNKARSHSIPQLLLHPKSK